MIDWVGRIRIIVIVDFENTTPSIRTTNHSRASKRAFKLAPPPLLSDDLLT